MARGTEKQRFHAARMKIAFAANRELLSLYYELGARIIEREQNARWGSGFIDIFSRDLKKEFPFYCDVTLWQQPVAIFEGESWFGVKPEIASLVSQVPWGHNILIFSKATDFHEAAFYLGQTIENGWSRDVLVLQMESDLYTRAGKVGSNFCLSWERGSRSSDVSTSWRLMEPPIF